MSRSEIKLSAIKRLKAKRAFEQGESCRQVGRIAEASQRVWERELRAVMGDAAFEEQLELNKGKKTKARLTAD